MDSGGRARSAAALRREHRLDALPDASHVHNFYHRIRDPIEQHDPDLLYFDKPCSQSAGVE